MRNDRMNDELSRCQEIFARAAQAFQQGRFPEAERLADEILQIRPSERDALQMKVLAAVQSGRAAAVTATARKLVAEFPQDASAHNTLAAVLQQGGSSGEAIEALGRATQLDPN